MVIIKQMMIYINWLMELYTDIRMMVVMMMSLLYVQ